MTKKELEHTIDSLNDYFVQKLMDGDYEVKEVTEHLVHLEVDHNYSFSIWMANGWQSVSCYSLRKYFMDLSFTNEQKLRIYQDLEEFIYKKQRHDRIKELEDELNRLKSKQNEL